MEHLLRGSLEKVKKLREKKNAPTVQSSMENGKMTNL
jgi:hypothetical protein